MSTPTLACAAAAAAAVVALVPAAAHAVYVDPAIGLTVSDTTVVEGASLTAKATSTLDCDWTISFAGTAEQGSGTTFTAGFTAPDVDNKTTLPLVGRCGYDDAAPSSTPARAADTAAAVPVATREASRTVQITVLPKGAAETDDNGVLPDTGGSTLTLLLVGGALVVAGAGITVAARRRGARASGA
jgi:LPXTG-motif cell wall-anchored protein